MKEPTMAIQTRLETPADADQVRRVVESAFGQADEANLVDQLRQVDGTFALVAIRENELVGHIMFSPVAIANLDPALSCIGLAPMAVRADVQSQGIGSALVEAGLQEARRRGIAAVVVLGHRSYYPRFGFESAAKWGLTCRWPASADSFMALELVPGSFGNQGGRVEYAQAFNVF
jgi:putative acetyltransferase